MYNSAAYLLCMKPSIVRSMGLRTLRSTEYIEKLLHAITQKENVLTFDFILALCKDHPVWERPLSDLYATLTTTMPVTKSYNFFGPKTIDTFLECLTKTIDGLKSFDIYMNTPMPIASTDPMITVKNQKSIIEENDFYWNNKNVIKGIIKLVNGVDGNDKWIGQVFELKQAITSNLPNYPISDDTLLGMINKNTIKLREKHIAVITTTINHKKIVTIRRHVVYTELEKLQNKYNLLNSLYEQQREFTTQANNDYETQKAKSENLTKEIEHLKNINKENVKFTSKVINNMKTLCNHFNKS